MSKKVHVKTGDTDVVIKGKDRGKTGKVIHVSHIHFIINNLLKYITQMIN